MAREGPAHFLILLYMPLYFLFAVVLGENKFKGNNPPSTPKQSSGGCQQQPRLGRGEGMPGRGPAWQRHRDGTHGPVRRAVSQPQ